MKFFGGDAGGAAGASRGTLLAAAVSGFLIAGSFLRFQIYPLAWFAFVPFLWVVLRAPSRRSVIQLSWVAGLATNIPAFYWLVYTINVFGGFPTPVAVIFYLCLSFFTASQFVLFGLAVRSTGPGPLAIAPALIWVSLEFLFPNIFPWRMGHSQYLVPTLMQIGDITGPYGLSFVMLWFATGIALLPGFGEKRPALSRRAAPLIASLIAVAGVIAYGRVQLARVDGWLAAAPTATVALVQGNIDMDAKFEPSLLDMNLERFREISRPLQANTDLIVWPETTSQTWIPADTTQLGPKENPFPDLATHLFFGGLAYRMTGPKTADEFNTSFLIGAEGRVYGRYDKRVMMPFGEYIPFASYFPIIKQISPATGGFTAGEEAKVFDVGGKMKLGPLICYEDLFADIPRETTLAGAEILLNILNDAWYGDSEASVQHQALAIWRSVENRRYLLRGSNDGVTSIIDPAGRIVDEAPLHTRGFIRGTVHPLRVQSFYTRFGDVFAWLMVSSAAALLLLARRQRPA